MTFCCGDYDSRKSFLLEKKSQTHDMKSFFSDSDKSNDPARSWIKLNVDQIGFFRVKYDQALAAKLRYAIENNYLSVTDRLGNSYIFFSTCIYSSWMVK